MDEVFLSEWKKITDFISDLFDHKNPDMDAILFIIGIRELGFISDENFSKEDKVQLLHIATCRVLSYSGYFEFEKTDENGWPHWKSLKPFEVKNVTEQELLLKQHIIEYFKQEEIIEF